MEFKYLRLNNNDSIVKLNGCLFIHIREYANKFLVTSSIELDDGKGCYDKYINMFEDKRNNILINKDFNSKKVEIQGINVIMFNLAETSLYSICLDEYYNIWLYNKTKQTWARLYGYNKHGKYQKVTKQKELVKLDLVEQTFGEKATILGNTLRFKLEQAKENKFYFRLLTNTGQEQQIMIASDDKIYLNRTNKLVEPTAWIEYKPTTPRGLFTIKIGEDVLIAQELLRTEHDLIYLADNGSIWKIPDFNRPQIVSCIAKIENNHYIDNLTNVLGVITYAIPNTYKKTKVYNITDNCKAVRTANGDVILCGLDKDNNIKFIDNTNYTNNGINMRKAYEKVKEGKIPEDYEVDLIGYSFNIGYTELELDMIMDNKSKEEQLFIAPEGDIWVIRKDVVYDIELTEVTKVYELTPSGYIKLNKNYVPTGLLTNVEIGENKLHDCKSIYVNRELKTTIVRNSEVGTSMVTNDNYCTANDKCKHAMDYTRYFKEKCNIKDYVTGLVNICGTEKQATLVIGDVIIDELLPHIEDIYLTEDLNLYMKLDYFGYVKWEHLGRID